MSIDSRSSIFGYYSRFHGGLLSSISYSLLYWAYVANFDRQKTIKAMCILLTSALLVSIYGVLQHFGIDKNIWVQDVQNRIFSTLGQPNWLAAWIVALLPLTWVFLLGSKFKTSDSSPSVLSSRSKNSDKLQSIVQNFWLLLGLNSLFFLTLLYTKSRSGILAFVIANSIFWILTIWNIRKKEKKYRINTIKTSIICHSSFVILALACGTPWTPSLPKLLNKIFTKTNHHPPSTIHHPLVAAPALEIGGTESGTIRKIVWKGALDIWKNYPILGTGVETFAFSYYQFRPKEHNLVSEWDFLYNKAHNEYLNFLATTGSVGTLAYLILIFASLYQLSKSKFPNAKHQSLLTTRALLSGYVSILATNFFGFSVIPVALLTFLYPAMAIAMAEQRTKNKEQKSKLEYSDLNHTQKMLIIFVLCAMSYSLFAIGKYWYADISFAKGKSDNDTANYTTARRFLKKAVKLSSHEAIFWNELSEATTGIAVKLSEQGNQDKAIQFAKTAISESDRAVTLSPANVNLKRDRASMFIKLSIINPNLLTLTRDTLTVAIQQAPTDAKLYYNLALSYVRTGDNKGAIDTLKQTIELKPNYTKAYYALGLIYLDEVEEELAKQQFQYILEKLDPKFTPAQKELEKLSQ
jgi:putative inorganic carbon (HCO3(-)) transporter